MEGVATTFRSPQDAAEKRALPSSIKSSTSSALTAAENIFLGQKKRMAAIAKQREASVGQAFKRLGVEIDLDIPCRRMTTAHLTWLVKNCQSPCVGCQDPGDGWAKRSVSSLAMSSLRGDSRSDHRGIGIIYISHRLEEIFTIAQRVIILRDQGQRRRASPWRTDALCPD
ncbi:MAG: hypothetical protein U0894_12870 [Pirellulales bacterium]